jgi:hypothetical protein
VFRPHHSRTVALYGGDDTVRTVLLPGGHSLHQLHDRDLWLSRRHNTVRAGVLRRRCRVRERLDEYLQWRGLDMPDRAGALRTQVLRGWPALFQRCLLHTHDMCGTRQELRADLGRVRRLAQLRHLHVS